MRMDFWTDSNSAFAILNLSERCEGILAIILTTQQGFADFKPDARLMSMKFYCDTAAIP